MPVSVPPPLALHCELSPHTGCTPVHNIHSQLLMSQYQPKERSTYNMYTLYMYTAQLDSPSDQQIQEATDIYVTAVELRLMDTPLTDTSI